MNLIMKLTLNILIFIIITPVVDTFVISRYEKIGLVKSRETRSLPNIPAHHEPKYDTSSAKPENPTNPIGMGK